MRRTLTAVSLVLALLTACSSDNDTASDSGDEQTAGEVAGALENAGIPPEPDQATADAYITALEAIDPGIDRNDPESAIDRGRDQCSTIRANPGDRAAQVDTTNQRFTSPDHPEGWGPEVAAQILDVVHLHLCPTF